MNMLVFVKRVPDTESRIRIQQNAVAEDGLNFVASPYDEYALDLPPARKAGRVLQGDPAEAARDLVRLLRDEAKVI